MDQDQYRYLHQIGENGGNVLPTFFPQLQNAEPTASGHSDMAPFNALVAQIGTENLRRIPMRASNLEENLLSQANQKPTKPRRSSLPAMGVCPQTGSRKFSQPETKKDSGLARGKGSEPKGPGSKTESGCTRTKGGSESKARETKKDSGLAQAVGSPTISVGNPAQDTRVVQLPLVPFSLPTGSAVTGMRTRKSSKINPIPTISEETQTEDLNTLTEGAESNDWVAELGAMSIKGGNVVFPKICHQTELVVSQGSQCYRDGSASTSLTANNPSAATEEHVKVSGELASGGGDEILAGGNSVEALEDHNYTSAVESEAKLEELKDASFPEADTTANIALNATAGIEWDDLLKSPNLTLALPNDPMFAPVDVCKTKTTTFVTCQVTNEVARFDGGEFKGVMKRTDTRTFDCPRYVMAVPGLQKDPSECIVLILDNIGIHVFHEDGNFIKTFLLGEGYKYRGLAHYECFQESVTSAPKLVTLNVSGCKAKLGVFVCVFSFGQDLRSVTRKKKVLITPTCKILDPKCRFVAVKSDCVGKPANCRGHTAFVTALESRCVYMVDLVTGISSVITLVSNSIGELTFASNTVGDEESSPFWLKQPTGICFDKSGNILVADKIMSEVLVFAPNGLLLRTFRLLGQPLGLLYQRDEDMLYVADNSGRQVLVFSDFSNTLANRVV